MGQLVSALTVSDAETIPKLARDLIPRVAVDRAAMPVRVWINGEVFDEASARISVFDRGFLYGDSIYEVMRTASGRPVDLDAHLDRLRRSGEAIALPIASEPMLREAIAEVLEAARNPESYVRVIATRGAGEIGLDTSLADDPKTLIIVRPLALPPRELYERGASIRIVGVQRTPRRAMDPAVRSGNYLNNIMALAEARRAGAYEALMCDARGRVAEGSTSNVFAVRGGELYTPALEIGLLAGITRQRVIELARDDGLEVVEGTLTPDDVRGADEVFITSSIRGVLPIGEVDGKAIAAPGPITSRLMERYARYLRRMAT
jgi:branched-chain amino acid aminotransferase